MPINYRTFCFWARSNLSSVKRAGDRLGQLARTEIDVARWKLLAEIGDELVPALAYLTTVGINDTRTAEELEAEIVAAVNRPIETAAEVVRETRDAAWVRRIHAACHWLLKAIDEEFDDPTEIIKGK